MIELWQVSKYYSENEKPAVNNISLKVHEGNIMAIVGPSGCGKTTVLRMVNRLVEPSSGKIYINGEDTGKVDQDELRRRIGYVIQQIGLFPHRKVKENVALIPKLLNWSKSEIDNRVNYLLSLIGLDPEEVKEKYPHQLSGGQMQRVGVARAMAADPPIMLMDEPFGAVDPIIRKRLQNEFLKLQQSLNKTIMFVTHDIDEALKMGDYIVIMNEGQLIQQATPIELLSNPVNDFVVNLLGENRGVRILDLIKVKNLMRTDSIAVKTQSDTGELLKNSKAIEPEQPVKVALETMMRQDADNLYVVAGSEILGEISWQQIKSHINSVDKENNALSAENYKARQGI